MNSPPPLIQFCSPSLDNEILISINGFLYLFSHIHGQNGTVKVGQAFRSNGDTKGDVIHCELWGELKRNCWNS